MCDWLASFGLAPSPISWGYFDRLKERKRGIGCARFFFLIFLHLWRSLFFSILHTHSLFRRFHGKLAFKYKPLMSPKNQDSFFFCVTEICHIFLSLGIDWHVNFTSYTIPIPVVNVNQWSTNNWLTHMSWCLMHESNIFDLLNEHCSFISQKFLVLFLDLLHFFLVFYQLLCNIYTLALSPPHYFRNKSLSHLPLLSTALERGRIGKEGPAQNGSG